MAEYTLKYINHRARMRRGGVCRMTARKRYHRQLHLAADEIAREHASASRSC